MAQLSKADLVRKIRALHARALRGGSAEEAATAARKAHELKMAHQITDEDLRETVQQHRGRPNGGGGQSPPPPPSQPRSDLAAEQAAAMLQRMLADVLGSFQAELELAARQQARKLGRSLR